MGLYFLLPFGCNLKMMEGGSFYICLKSDLFLLLWFHPNTSICLG